MSQESINTLMKVVIVPLLSVIVPFIIQLLRTKTTELKNRINNADINKYVDIAEDAIETAVVSTQQTFVDTVKNTVDWDTEAQELAFTLTKTNAVKLMGETAKVVMQTLHTDFDSWLEHRIEYYVHLNK